MRVESLFLATIRKPLFTLRLFDYCLPSVKKYRLGTLKCHDHDIFTLHQPIRLQHFERGNEKCRSLLAGDALLIIKAFLDIIDLFIIKRYSLGA